VKKFLTPLETNDRLVLDLTIQVSLVGGSAEWMNSRLLKQQEEFHALQMTLKENSDDQMKKLKQENSYLSKRLEDNETTNMTLQKAQKSKC